jgi:ABC-2 type transport system ATP-binding protein
MATVLTSRSSGGPAISLRSIRKSYAGNPAVRGIDLELVRGETVALLGPNGAGKTTTISMMLGLISPDAGELRIVGSKPRVAVASGKIAAMLQDSGLMPGVRVAELVRLAERLYPQSLPTAEALDIAGLTSFAKRRVDRLSGGESQRLRFALAIVANPEILVLDEPTRALDVQGRAEFWVSMRAFAAQGRTVLFATHYLDEVDENADRVVVMAQGRIVADGQPSEIRNRTGISTVRFTLRESGSITRSTGGAERQLAGLPGVTDAALRGDRVTLKTSSADATVAALVNGPLAWHSIEVGPPSLDESFLALTQEQS